MLRIKQICKQKGIKGAQVAKHLGIKPSAYSIGLKRESFTAERLQSIATFIGVPVAELFDSSVRVSIKVEHNGSEYVLSESELLDIKNRKQ
jgi:transcriptional regulator with XRE-family HTH domain